MKGITAFAFVTGVLLTPSLMYGHHSRAGFYQEAESRVTLQGTVKEFRWTNPHAYILLERVLEGGEVEMWAIELGSPGNLTQSAGGWSHDVLKPGDSITITTHPARDGKTRGLGAHVVFADGREGPSTFDPEDDSDPL